MLGSRGRRYTKHHTCRYEEMYNVYTGVCGVTYLHPAVVLHSRDDIVQIECYVQERVYISKTNKVRPPNSIYRQTDPSLHTHASPASDQVYVGFMYCMCMHEACVTLFCQQIRTHP